jgi:hypothetical protein
VASRSWAAGAQRLTTQDGHLRNLGIPVSCGWGGCGWLWGRLGPRPTLAALGICQFRLWDDFSALLRCVFLIREMSEKMATKIQVFRLQKRFARSHAKALDLRRVKKWRQKYNFSCFQSAEKLLGVALAAAAGLRLQLRPNVNCGVFAVRERLCGLGKLRSVMGGKVAEQASKRWPPAGSLRLAHAFRKVLRRVACAAPSEKWPKR